MAQGTSADNKRIAKNTLLLYVRMLYSLVISLFTSRVILAALGFEDYGLYNVIGSVVTMFIFLRSAMGNSVHRFIAFAIGKGDIKRLNDVFSMSIMIHLALALVIVLLCETVGVWFLNTQMTIPDGRLTAANWVFQFSVISCAVSVMCVPFDAEIVAHECIGIYAVIQMLTSTANLGIAYWVSHYDNDRLILYAFLLFIFQILSIMTYVIYCKKKFKETSFRFVGDKSLLKEMTGFAGWSLIGNMAYIGYSQGINLLLNVFFGPAVNAARGIAFQIQGAVKGFVTNFQMAVNPQITKSYAQENYERLHSLIYTSSKFSFYLLLCMVLPIAIESKWILNLWLGDVPDYTVIFTILTLAIMLVDTLSNPIGVANNATGSIRNYQIVEGGSLLLILPISYITLKLGASPVSVFIVQLIIMYSVQVLRLFIVCHKINMSKRDYFSKVILRIVSVTVVSSVIPILLYINLSHTIINAIAIIGFSILSVLVTAYLIGINNTERNIINSKVLQLIKKN